MPNVQGYRPFLVFQNQNTNDNYWPSFSYKLANEISYRKDCSAKVLAIGLIFAAIIDTLSFAVRAAGSPSYYVGNFLHEKWKDSPPLGKGLLIGGGIFLEIVAIAYTPINIAIQIVFSLGHVLRNVVLTAVGVIRPNSKLFAFIAEVSIQGFSIGTGSPLFEPTQTHVPKTEPKDNLQPGLLIVETDLGDSLLSMSVIEQVPLPQHLAINHVVQLSETTKGSYLIRIKHLINGATDRGRLLPSHKGIIDLILNFGIKEIIIFLISTNETTVRNIDKNSIITYKEFIRDSEFALAFPILIEQLSKELGIVIKKLFKTVSEPLDKTKTLPAEIKTKLIHVLKNVKFLFAYSGFYTSNEKFFTAINEQEGIIEKELVSKKKSEAQASDSDFLMKLIADEKLINDLMVTFELNLRQKIFEG